MKTLLSLMLLILLLAACAPTSTPQPSPITPIPTQAPPAGTTLYDGCAFTVSYPSQLALDGSGWYVSFSPGTEELVQVTIQATRQTGARPETVAAALGDQFGFRGADAVFESLTVVDSLGQPVPGVEGDLVAQDEHLRLMVVVRPETLLGNTLPDDVVYQIVARAPQAQWPQWAPLFDVIFQTFHPQDCGGV
jgi:hypothetical protein